MTEARQQRVWIGKEFDRSPSTTFPHLDELSDWVRAQLRADQVVKRAAPKHGARYEK